MIYLIGGPARCGKSTLAKRVRREIEGQIIAGDAFFHALKNNLQPEWTPDLYDHSVDPINEITGIDAKVDRLRRRDQTAWRFYEAYIATATMDAPADDILIEGNIWPDMLGSLPAKHKAVFLVDTSADQAIRLMSLRDSDTTDNNWMKDFSNEKMAEWAKFNICRSQRYIDLCQQSAYSYYDIADHGIEGAELRAFEYLLQKEV
jgi:uridine kinase